MRFKVQSAWWLILTTLPSFLFTVSFNDFKIYKDCPRKLSFKVMDFSKKPSEPRPEPSPARSRTLKVASKIGIIGERIQKEIISARELGREVSEEDFKKSMKAVVTKTIAGRGSIEKKHRRRLLRELSDVEYLLKGLPKVYRHYEHPFLRNRYVCSKGIPDFLVRLYDGWYIIEVKNVAPESIGTVFITAKEKMRFYNALLRDRLSDAELRNRLLPKPKAAKIVFPRASEPEEKIQSVSVGFPEFPRIAKDIWNIKCSAFVYRSLPQLTKESEKCRVCKYRRRCRGGEVLDRAKPLPLVYAAAKLDLMERKGAETPLKFKEVIRLFPNEIESWGGPRKIKPIELGLKHVSNEFYPLKREKIVLNAMRRWRL